MGVAPRDDTPAAPDVDENGVDREQIRAMLSTTCGDLDCLGTIDQDRGYEELLGQTVEMRRSGGRTVRVLSLPALIEAKERSGRPKDLAVLPVLRATLDETNRRL
jgi:hypothetical protein